MNIVLVDNDILSYFLKGDEYVLSNFVRYFEYYDIIEISVITYYEIIGGLLAKDAKNQIKAFEKFISQNIILPLTDKSAHISAQLYATLKQKGNIVDDIDLLIAGIAIENELVLVTNNEEHFNRIPNLEVCNWKKEKPN